MGLAEKLIRWQKKHGRRDLPWQGTRDPYLIWVSEIMLQQTQVATVIPYFKRFIQRFPDISTLARASEEEVLACWAGLGYYARGRNLHRAANLIKHSHSGIFPDSPDEITALSGIGRSTAAAISVFAFGRRAAILDGNVKRVLARTFAVEGWPGDKKVESRLWVLAECLLPEHEIETYTQALMDLGATVCTRTRPDCESCPLKSLCKAFKYGKTDQFPASRPVKKLPEKHAQLLVIRHGQDVLLEKRPSSGIWGGLWSLPQTEPNIEPHGLCLTLTGSMPARVKPLPPFTHVFTHFRLHIQPQEIMLNQPPHHVMEAGGIWMPIDKAIHAAVPKPVSRLLEILSARQSESQC